MHMHERSTLKTRSSTLFLHNVRAHHTWGIYPHWLCKSSDRKPRRAVAYRASCSRRRFINNARAAARRHPADISYSVCASARGSAWASSKIPEKPRSRTGRKKRHGVYPIYTVAGPKAGFEGCARAFRALGCNLWAQKVTQTLSKIANVNKNMINSIGIIISGNKYGQNRKNIKIWNTYASLNNFVQNFRDIDIRNVKTILWFL